MTGVIDAYEGDPTSPVMAPREPADTRVPSWWDAAKANWRLNLDDDEAGNYGNLVKGYDDLEDALISAGHPRSRYHNPDWNVTVLGYPLGTDNEQRQATMWADVEEARRTNPKAFANIPATRKEFETWAYARQGGRAKDQATAAQGGAGTSILPGLAFGIANMGAPENLAQIPLGGGATSVTGFLARQFAAGVLGQALQTPQVVHSRANMGEGYSSEDMARDLVLGGATNAAFAGIMTYGPKVAARGANAVLDRIDPARGDRQLADAFRQSIKGDWQATPEQAAALHILDRSADIDETNPYHRTWSAIDAHANRIQSVLDQLGAMPKASAPDLAPALAPAVRAVAPEFSKAWGAILHIEGGLAPDGSFRTSPAGAIGPAQLMPGTAPAAARLAGMPFDPVRLRTDRAYNEALGQALYGDLLRRFDGDADKAAAAYNAGEGSARKGTGVRGAMAKAAAAGIPDQWEKFLPAETQNYVRNFRDRTGGAGTSIAAPDMPDPLMLRPDALDAVRPSLVAGGREIPIASFAPGEIGVDANLMQFKSGGDAAGVTDRLRGVEQWDPMSAGMVTVWEGADGRRLIADGHQRLGLANRILAADPGQDVRLNAFVLREADGFSAADARTLTALKNIREGRGKAADAAKVFRDVGLDPELLKSLPPRSALIRDGKALASLSDEAFGAIINDVIPESYGAAIGALAPDPATHMALVDLLAKTDPANRRQAEAIVRQAVDAGFHEGTQEELFGTRTTVSSIFAQKARLLDKTLGELRKLKGAFGVAARNADALDAAGNRIDVSASEAEVRANAEALGLVDALALRKGNAVSDLFNRAAQRLAEGEPLAAVTRDVVAELRQLDLSQALRDAGEPGGQPGGSGRASLADEEAQAGSGEPGALSSADRDELEAAGQGGFTFFDEQAHQAFDDPAGAGVAQAAQSVWHDARADVPGPFGPVFRDVDPSNWKAVVARLSEAQDGEVQGALEYPGVGRIDVVWGKPGTGKHDGYGLSKILQFHPEVADDLPHILAGMTVASESSNRIKLESADHEASIRLDWNGQHKAWLMTAYEKDGRASPATEYARAAGDAQAGNAPAREAGTDIGAIGTKDNPSADPNIAARQRQQAQLGAEGPMRAKVEQDGVMGSPLFDAADQPKFDLGDGKGERPIAEIEAELDADDAAIDAIKGCLL